MSPRIPRRRSAHATRWRTLHAAVAEVDRSTYVARMGANAVEHGDREVAGKRHEQVLEAIASLTCLASMAANRFSIALSERHEQVLEAIASLRAELVSSPAYLCSDPDCGCRVACEELQRQLDMVAQAAHDARFPGDDRV